MFQGRESALFSWPGRLCSFIRAPALHEVHLLRPVKNRVGDLATLLLNLATFQLPTATLISFFLSKAASDNPSDIS